MKTFTDTKVEKIKIKTPNGRPRTFYVNQAVLEWKNGGKELVINISKDG